VEQRSQHLKSPMQSWLARHAEMTGGPHAPPPSGGTLRRAHVSHASPGVTVAGLELGEQSLAWHSV